MSIDWTEHLPWQVHSSNVRIIQAQVAQHLKSFTLLPREGSVYSGRVAHIKVGRLALTVVGYGAEIEIDAGKLGQFSILQWPLSGSYSLHVGQRRLDVSANIAHLISPGVPVRMVFSPDCLLLVVRMSAQGARELGAEIDASDLLAQGEAEALGLPLDLTTHAGQSLKRSLSFLAQESFFGELFSRQRALGRLAEDVYLAALKNALASQPKAIDGHSKNAQPPAIPRYLERAEAFLLAHLKEPVTLQQAALAAGVSASTLTQSFRAVHALSPLAWWRTKRLDRAYEALADSHAKAVSVTDVGLEWGFAHLGRFSRAYKRRFGESPRQTLQRARATHGKASLGVAND